MLHAFSRTELLLGPHSLQRLSRARVAVFGIGGVGSFTVEALARSGVGRLVLVDDDDVCLTNINRQLHATTRTVGQAKVELMKQRVLEINPRAQVQAFKVRYLKDTSDQLLSPDYDYVVDAIDMIAPKVHLIVRSQELGIPIISSMGAGNKFDPTRFEVADIYQTSICPLARVMRKQLRKHGVERLKVVYSREEPVTPLETSSTCANSCICPDQDAAKCHAKKQIPGSLAFVPSVAGLILAAEVVKDLTATLNTESFPTE